MSEELILKIKELFKDKKDIMESLLSDDITIRKEAIRQIGTYSNSGFTSEEIVNAYKAGKKHIPITITSAKKFFLRLFISSLNILIMFFIHMPSKKIYNLLYFTTVIFKVWIVK